MAHRKINRNYNQGGTTTGATDRRRRVERGRAPVRNTLRGNRAPLRNINPNMGMNNTRTDRNFHLITLKNGENLVSFPFYNQVGLEQDYCNDLNSLLPYSGDYADITEVQTATRAATRLPVGPNEGQWVGSLSQVCMDEGYWVKAEIPTGESKQYSFMGTSVLNIMQNWHYELQSGNNLISFPFPEAFFPGQSPLPIDGFLSPEVAESKGITGLIGTGIAATLVNGQWVGSLAERGLKFGEGYWLTTNIPSGTTVPFQWTLDGQCFGECV